MYILYLYQRYCIYEAACTQVAWVGICRNDVKMLLLCKKSRTAAMILFLLPRGKLSGCSFVFLDEEQDSVNQRTRKHLFPSSSSAPQQTESQNRPNIPHGQAQRRGETALTGRNLEQDRDVGRSSDSASVLCFHREKMIYSILLLVVLTASVCGKFTVSVTQPSYHAEENSNIMMEWIFSPIVSLNHLNIDCALWLSDYKTFKTLYHFKGIEHPESQHQQFVGRARCDKDGLRQGHIRFHLSRLHINDSGVYQCEVFTDNDEGADECSLTVTPAKAKLEDPEEEELTWTIVIGAVTAAAVVLLAAVVSFIRCLKKRGQRQQQDDNSETIDESNRETVSSSRVN